MRGSAHPARFVVSPRRTRFDVLRTKLALGRALIETPAHRVARGRGAVELELGPGLNVVTGETGAGKSLVLGALALLAGARAAADAVREGASEARVEAVLRAAALPALERELAERGLAVEDGTS